MLPSRYIFLIFILLLQSSFLKASQLSIVNSQLSILLRVGDYDFIAEDFEYVYQRNRLAGNQTLEECMALYIPYKLKIVAAKEAGLDAQPEIIDEWTRFRHQYSSSQAADELLDGLLLYAMTDNVVWSKASRDSAGLRAFYKKNARRFRWDKRLEATIYYCANASVAERLQSAVKNKNESNGRLSNILFSFFCDANGVNPCVDTARVILPKGANTVADRVKWKKGCSKIFELNEKFVFLEVHIIHRSARKTFEEARGQVVAGYQDELERKWVEQLKKQYPVTLNEGVWADLKRKYAE